MKTTAILVSGGNVQGIYKVHGAPHNKVIIVDEDNLRDSENRQQTAFEQLEGFGTDGEIEFDEIHSELSNYISSDDVYST